MGFLSCMQAPAPAASQAKPRRRFSLFSRKPPTAGAGAAPKLTLSPTEQTKPRFCTPAAEAVAEVESVAEPPACTAARTIAELAASLTAAAQGARAHRASCLGLAACGDHSAAAVGGLDLVALTAMPPARLDGLAALLADGVSLAASCSLPGWLLEAAAPEEGAGEAIAALHAGLLTALKEAGLDAPPGAPRLPAPECPANAARALHRRLRQLGAGSLRGGLAVLAGDEEEQRAVAATLGVEPADLAADAAHILARGLAPPDTAAAAAGEAAAGDSAVADARPALTAVFEAFAAFGQRDAAAPALDSFRAFKLAREAGLLAPGAGLNPQQFDVLFAKAAGRGARRLDMDGFLRLLALVAGAKGCALAEVVAAVSGLRGPAASGATQPEAVRLHDDRATYTGVYARGGMSVADPKIELRSMVDRDAADRAARRQASAAAAARRSTAGSLTPPLTRTASAASAAGPGLGGSLTPRGAADGGTTLRGLPPASAFIRPGVPRLALPAAAGGQTTPRLSASAAGFYSARGPARNGAGMTPPRSARGPSSGVDAFRRSPLVSARSRPRAHPLTPTALQATPPPAQPSPPPSLSAEEERGVRRTFDLFGAWGKDKAASAAAPAAADGAVAAEPAPAGLDSAQFAKLVRDCGLLGRGLNATRADLVFIAATAAAAQKGPRRLTYEALLAAVPKLAEARGCTPAEVVRRLAACEGPTRTATTTPENVRLSERASFCGIAARGGPAVVEKRVTLEAAVDRSGRRSALAPYVE